MNVAAGVYVLFLSFQGIWLPSNFAGNGNAQFRYQHECDAMVREWERYGYRGECLEAKPDGESKSSGAR